MIGNQNYKLKNQKLQVRALKSLSQNIIFLSNT